MLRHGIWMYDGSYIEHFCSQTGKRGPLNEVHLKPVCYKYNLYSFFQCRLRFTSIALQRWLIAFLMYIILWSFTYIIYWVKHEASMMDIALFLIPILVLPIVCSAYGEVNYEGKRMLRVSRS